VRARKTCADKTSKGKVLRWYCRRIEILFVWCWSDAKKKGFRINEGKTANEGWNIVPHLAEGTRAPQKMRFDKKHERRRGDRLDCTLKAHFSKTKKGSVCTVWGFSKIEEYLRMRGGL